MAENTIFGTQQAIRKEKFRGKSILEENIQTVALPPAEVCECFAFDFISNLLNDKRVEQFCDCLLENYIDADSTFPPPVWSVCSAPSYRTTKACESFHAYFNSLLCSAHPNILAYYA